MAPPVAAPPPVTGEDGRSLHAKGVRGFSLELPDLAVGKCETQKQLLKRQRKHMPWHQKDILQASKPVRTTALGHEEGNSDQNISKPEIVGCG